jgi:formylglycine-generating enzyme required for sulfatase activity
VRSGGWKVGLPSEMEWEKAARGPLPDAIFPWGDVPEKGFVNDDDSQIKDTSAVGCFPANGFGIYDMIGNVWEWTRSPYGLYPFCPKDVSENANPSQSDLMIVRGGSWHHPSPYARCAYRSWNLPDFRSASLGFRVVLRSVPVS